MFQCAAQFIIKYLGIRNGCKKLVIYFLSLLLYLYSWESIQQIEKKHLFIRMKDDYITGHSNWDTVEGLQQSLAMLCFILYWHGIILKVYVVVLSLAKLFLFLLGAVFKFFRLLHLTFKCFNVHATTIKFATYFIQALS